jgi:hypothetical protein
MPTGDGSRPEAVTTAKWWGDVLRNLVTILKPVEMLSADDVPDDDDPIDRACKLAYIHRAKKVVRLLTANRIDAFQRYLALIVEAEMVGSRNSYCSLTQPAPEERRNDRFLHQALVQAEIDPFPFGGASIFTRSMSAHTRPGMVRVYDDGGSKLLEIVNE